MAALVQAFPAQQTATSVSLLQTRPQSASSTLQSNSQQHSIMQQRSMSSYGHGAGNNTTGYRSYSGSAPVAPYAFTSTPGLTNGHNKQQMQAWTDNKSPAVRQFAPDETRLRYPVSDTSSSSSSISSDPPSRYHQSHHQAATLTVRTNPNLTTRPTSIAALPSPPILPATTSSRPSPDRYRRKKSDSNVSASSIVPLPVGSAMPSGSGMAAVGAHYTPIRTPGRTNSPVTSAPAGRVMNPIGSYTGQLRSQSVDDIHTHRPPSGTTKQKLQQRRASVGAFSAGSLTMIGANNGQGPDLSTLQLPSFAPQATNQRPHAKGSAPNMVARRGSNDSSASAKSSSSHSHRPNSSPKNNNTPTSSSPTMNPVGSHEINLAHVPPRDSSHINKRSTTPSPLSKPVNMNAASDSSPQPQNGTSNPIPSAAAERLAALSADPRKGLKNRLRRAFSFGSAAELRKAAAGNSGDAAERIRLRQERFREEQQAEQSKIAQQQEASGLGEGIYSNGQGHFFSGSTDNLSVSSTASSASIMIRKMGKGMKKSTRSLVGLFRPRSVIGVEAASGPVGTEPTAAQVTMVNVEADKGKTNTVAQKDEMATSAKGTGLFDAAAERPASAVNGSASEVVSRRGGSFVGGDRERAEVLASVKKGILKRQGSSSPVIKPVDNSTGQLSQLPPSSLPLAETGRQSPAKHQRDNSLTIEGEEYFMKSPRFAGKTPQSAPPSPSGGKGNVTFSPRITFHDTWPSGEYDRRGDVATCNRLTPALAQQIKEELNTFKMEMDVHEESKIYTHFF